MKGNVPNLTNLLFPNLICITGNFDDPEDVGGYILRNIVFSGYAGKIYLIDRPNLDLYDLQSFTSIEEVNEDIDLYLICSPVDDVLEEVNKAVESRVKGICIITRGFADMGSRGRSLQKKIVKICKENDIALLGPNSVGLISTTKGLNATFSKNMPKVGKSVFLSQSGALINAISEYSDFYSMGISEVIGLGNKGGLSELDLLKYYASLRADGTPDVVGMYLENIQNGREFLEYAELLSKKCPIIALVPSESPKTREYILGNTGSVLQKDEIIDAALLRTGVMKVYTQEQLFDLMLGFSWQVNPKGNKVAVISNAGSGLILAIEQIYSRGLELAEFSTEVKKILIEELNWKSAGKGVIDLGAEALSNKYLRALDVILGDNNVDAVSVIVSPQIMTQIEESAETIGRLAKQHGKTVTAAFMGYEGVENGIGTLSKFFIPAYKSVDRSIFVLSMMYDYELWRKKSEKKEFSEEVKSFERGVRSQESLAFIESARAEKKQTLGLEGCRDLLKNYDLDLATRKSKNIGGEFKVRIKKDQYYKFREKGLSKSELEDLSFGYILQILDNETEGSYIDLLLPVKKEELRFVQESNFFLKEVGVQDDQEFKKFFKELLFLVSKLSSVIEDYSQLLSVNVLCRWKKEKLSLLECQVDLDLIAN